MLMNLSASVSSVPCFEKVLDLCGTTPDSVTMYMAAEEGNVEVVKYLLKNACPFDNRTTGRACANGHVNVVQALLDSGIGFDMTSISNAAQNGHLAMVKYLLMRLSAAEDYKFNLEQLMENLASPYSTESFIFAHSKFGFGDRPIDVLVNCVTSSNAASLTYCLTHGLMSEAKSMIEEIYIRASCKNCAMVMLCLYKNELPVPEITDSVELSAARAGNIFMLIHCRLTKGPLNVTACIKHCRMAASVGDQLYESQLRCWICLYKFRSFFAGD